MRHPEVKRGQWVLPLALKGVRQRDDQRLFVQFLAEDFIVFDGRASDRTVDLTANDRLLQAGVVHRRKGEFNVGVSSSECLDKRWQKAVGRRPNKTDPQYAALA